MAGELTATFGKPFKEAIAAFRLRLGNLVPTARWDDLWQDQHDRAFMVAGATKADLLADLAAAVEKAIAQGTSLEEFRRDFRKIVEERGWHGWTGEGTKAGEAWRTRVIYRTNMRVSYAAGRMAQLVEGGFTLWVYRHGGSVEPRIIHLGWDGLVLPPDHPFWATHAPPNGWGCSCYVVGARSFAGAQRLGGQPGKPLPDGWQAIDPKTGAPVGIDKGWAYAPGASVVQDVIAQLRTKAKQLPLPLGDDLLSTIDEVAKRPDGKEVRALLQSIGVGRVGQVIDDMRARLSAAGVKAISPAEAAAIHVYTGPHHGRLNYASRQNALGLDASPDALRLVEIIDNALRRLPAFSGPTVRGITVPPPRMVEFFRTAPVGTRFSFESLSSSSKEAEKAFSGPIVFVIRGRSGRDVHWLSEFPEKEEEVLLPSGLQFTILARQERDGVLYLEVIEDYRHKWADLPLEARHAEQMG
jgi:hypothetical protein